MKISKALLLSIIKTATAEDAANNDKLAEHVRLTLSKNTAMISKYQSLMSERTDLVGDIAAIDTRVTNMQSRCAHELTDGISLCLTCGATV
jgi:uncharacterized protein YydD (DUF2326 family)